MSSDTAPRSFTAGVPEYYEEPGPWRRRIVFAVLVIGVLLALDAIWVVLKVRGQMESAQGALKRGADALLEGEVEEAGLSFDQATEATGGANGLLNHPAAAVAGIIPFISDDVRAVHRLIDAGAVAADAGTTLTGAAERVGWQGGSLSGLSQGDQSLAATLGAAGNDIRTASGKLQGAADILTETPLVGLTGPVRTAVVAGRDEVVARAGLLSSANDLAQVVPALFQDGRRYLLVVQNPNQPRGTGGYMGYMGFLHSDDGSLQLDDFFRTPAALARRPVEAPADYTERYEAFGALRDLRQANLSPDLPTSADVVLQMADQLGWGRFDGVMMVDPVWMKYMLETTGPVETPGWPDSITADNVVDVLGHDVFLLDQGSASDRAQDLIGTAVWEAVQVRNVSGAAMAEALARASTERHLQVYSTHPEEEATLARLGVSGQAAFGRNPLSVVWAATSDNKVGYFVERSLAVDVALDEDGAATVTTTVRMRNGAPDEPAGRLLGEGDDVPVGTWGSLVSVYMPERIEGRPTFDARGTETGTVEEFGHPVGYAHTLTPAGGSSTWSVTYVAPDAVTSSTGGSEYRLDFLPQASLSSIPISIRVHLPDGMTVTSTSPGMQTNGQIATFKDSVATTQSIWVRFT